LNPEGGWREAGEDCIMRSFITCMLHHILSGDQVKEDEMGGACSMHGRCEKCIQNFGGKPEGKRLLGRSRRRRRIMLEWILGKGCEGVDWIHLAQYRDKWRVLVNTVMGSMEGRELF
jgi:hypothetical protein